MESQKEYVKATDQQPPNNEGQQFYDDDQFNQFEFNQIQDNQQQQQHQQVARGVSNVQVENYSMPQQQINPNQQQYNSNNHQQFYQQQHYNNQPVVVVMQHDPTNPLYLEQQKFIQKKRLRCFIICLISMQVITLIGQIIKINTIKSKQKEISQKNKNEDYQLTISFGVIGIIYSVIIIFFFFMGLNALKNDNRRRLTSFLGIMKLNLCVCFVSLVLSPFTGNIFIVLSEIIITCYNYMAIKKMRLYLGLFNVFHVVQNPSQQYNQPYNNNNPIQQHQNQYNQ